MRQPGDAAGDGGRTRRVLRALRTKEKTTQNRHPQAEEKAAEEQAQEEVVLRGRSSLVARVAVAFLLLALRAAGDTLWTSDFQGYLGSAARLHSGDTIVITFTQGFSLSFKSVATENKKLTLELSGGPYGDLLSFLPAARTDGARTVTGDSQATLKGALAATVAEIEGGTRLKLHGLRVVAINGREESIELTGAVSAADVSADRRVDFSRLVEPRLVYRGPIEPADETVRAEDLEEIVAAAAAAVVPAAPGAAPAAAGAAAAPPPAVAAPAQPAQTRYRLSDERRRELLLRYVNRIVDVLF
jgi:hypothetical protein